MNVSSSKIDRGNRSCQRLNLTTLLTSWMHLNPDILLMYRRNQRATLNCTNRLTDCVPCTSFASEEQRAQMRKLVVGLPRDLGGQLLNHIGWARDRFLSSNDEEYVRRALAAASLDDNRSDFRDTFRALGYLYLAASSMGINCSRYFLEAAELSSTQLGIFPSVGSMRISWQALNGLPISMKMYGPRLSRY